MLTISSTSATSYLFQGFDGRLVRRNAADTRPSGSALRFSQYRRYLSLWFGSVLGFSPEEFLRQFGTHSGRIGGASAAANAGVAIERWGQHGSWRSASAQRGYMQMSEENIPSVSRAIMADPLTHDVREHGQGDDDNSTEADNGEWHPEVEAECLFSETILGLFGNIRVREAFF